MDSLTPRLIVSPKDLPSVEFECGIEAWAENAAQWYNEVGILKSFERGNDHWCYFFGEEFVGFGSIGKNTWSKFGEIAFIPMLAVRSEFQGRGYGRQIMGHLLDLSRNKVGTIGVGLFVHEDNTGARDLYDALGFEYVSLHGENHLKMFLPLSSEPKATA